MKVLAFIFSLVIATGLMLGGTILIFFQSPRHSMGPQLLAIFALTVMTYGPLSLGSLTSYWNVRRTAGSHRFYKRWLWVVIGLEFLGAIAIITFAVVVQAPVWLPVLFIAGGIALTGLSLLMGRLLRRHDEAHPLPPSWAPITRYEIQRKIAIIAITFVVVFAIAAVVLGVVGVGSHDAASQVGAQPLFALAFALFAAGFACVIVSLPLSRRLRDAVDRDLGTIRKVAKVVLSNKKLDLDQSEQVAAAKYAAIIPTTLSFMLGYLILLYLGLGIQQMQHLISGQVDAFTIGFSAFLVAALLIFIPIYAVRIRRARIYARNHADLLPTADEGSTGSADRA
ncbi:hypothetical protein ACSBOX_11250 [Arthrobacter sp. KN11-1C]|uniref:hypothetical protein n=1 Tax=Arthrobacter sp. KN11-1C TaxID=3445774 RepID=UPI003F9FA754